MLHTMMAGTALLATLGSGAAVSTAETARLQAASRIVDAIRNDIPDDYWTRARCVGVLPDLKKAAFIVGGEYGRGVLSCRAGDEWSAPVFVQLAQPIRHRFSALDAHGRLAGQPFGDERFDDGGATAALAHQVAQLDRPAGLP